MGDKAHVVESKRKRVLPPKDKAAFSRKDVTVSFRLGRDETQELDQIIRYAGVPTRSQKSSVLRLAIPFVHRSIQDGIKLGATDRDQAKPFNRRYERYRDGNDLDFFALGYNIGFNGKHSMLYRLGKAEGEADAKNNRSYALGSPLSATSPGYAVGYFDGYHGGYLAGLANGQADREEGNQLVNLSAELEQRACYRPPEGDPTFKSCFAVGYRTGYHSYDPDYLIPIRNDLNNIEGTADRLARLSRPATFPLYQRGNLKGTADRDTGKPYNPFSGDGVESDVDKENEQSWEDGYHDGYQGGRSAGTLEGEADRNNGKPYQPPSGLGALSDFAIGYRTAYRRGITISEDDEDDFDRLGDDERHRLENSVLVFEGYGFAEYEDGRALGLEDRQSGGPSKDPSSRYVAGYHACRYSPFVSGYRDGYGPEDRDEEFRLGYDEGHADRNNGNPARECYSDGLRDAGYRAGYHEDPSNFSPAEPRAQRFRKPRVAVVVKKRRALRPPTPVAESPDRF